MLHNSSRAAVGPAFRTRNALSSLTLRQSAYTVAKDLCRWIVEQGVLILYQATGAEFQSAPAHLSQSTLTVLLGMPRFMFEYKNFMGPKGFCYDVPSYGAIASLLGPKQSGRHGYWLTFNARTALCRLIPAAK